MNRIETPAPPASPIHTSSLILQPSTYLWLDGIGTWRLWLGSKICLGGPAAAKPGETVADIRLMAGLSRKHLLLERDGESYLLHPHGAVTLGNQPLSGPTLLGTDEQLLLGSDLHCHWRVPSPLSASASLRFIDSVTVMAANSPPRRLDGLVLLERTCLLGPGQNQHIICPDWRCSVVLFQRDGDLWCQSSDGLSLNDQPQPGPFRLSNNDIITGPELRFRVETSA